MNKNILITGITGQVGSYQADIQLAEGNKVYGLVRRLSTPSTTNISHISEHPNLELLPCDLTDGSGIMNIFNKYQIDECYHYGAMSHVHVSFSAPQSTFDINVGGTLNILEAIRHVSCDTKLFFAASSEMFGGSMGNLEEDGVYRQNEQTQLLPNSPYAVSKVAGHQLLRNYRDSYNLCLFSGITFNTESPRRGVEFVTRKITNYIGRLINSPKLVLPKLELGNLDAKRDWGYAYDCAIAAKQILSLSNPDDFVIATGQTNSISTFLDYAFGVVNIDDWSPYVQISPKYFRPSEVNYLCGNAQKLRKATGWQPTVTLRELISIMVKNDIEVHRRAQKTQA